MTIKNRFALYFTLISTTVLLIVLCAVYFIFLKFMEADFFARLTDRTMVTAKLYLEADEISSDSLEKVREQYLVKLNGEVIRIYNASNNATFIGDDQQYWTSETINKVRRERRLQYRDGLRQVVGIFYKDNQGDFVILASAVDKSTIYRLEKLRHIMIITFVVIFIGLLISARSIANKMLKPLDRFIDEVRQIKSNNLHFRVEEGKNKDEIHLLAQNFNNLMEHLEQSFVLQKTFIANASHELRTPITRMMIGAEITLSQERAAEEYKTALNDVLEEAGKMDDVITGLLNLAQADLELGSSKLELLRIDELLWEIIEDWNKKNEKGRVFLNMHHMPSDPAELFILANATLLSIAIGNILSNAHKFSDQQDIQCSLELEDAEICISITDQGPGIRKENRKEIFKPFFSAADEPGHLGKGMGLYMADKIISLFKGKLSLDTSKVPGTTFRIKLPKSAS